MRLANATGSNDHNDCDVENFEVSISDKKSL